MTKHRSRQPNGHTQNASPVSLPTNDSVEMLPDHPLEATLLAKDEQQLPDHPLEATLLAKDEHQLPDNPLLLPRENPPTQAARQTRTLTNCQRFSYVVGHVLNDLAASMWFSYLLVFLQEVRHFPNILAGNLMLVGQVSDAVATPFIGLGSDKTQGIKRIGKRKTWHLLGTVCVICSFSFLFNDCIGCADSSNIIQFMYYAPFVVIFQFGWASTQISHLSFANDCTPHAHERTLLQSVRHSFTVMSQLAVYGTFVLLFEVSGDGEDSQDLGPADAPKFRNLAFISIGLGVVCSLVFYFGTKEKRACPNLDTNVSEKEDDDCIEIQVEQRHEMNWKDWLKEPQFYQIAFLYMATRLYINVSQIYFPIYIVETIKMNKKSIAILPLVTQFSSLVVSILVPFINKLIGRKFSFMSGIAVGAASCVWLYCVGHNDNSVYVCAVLLGAAGSLLLITSIAFISDLISGDIQSGGFVMGAMSFTDKLSCGVAVLLVQTFHPCDGCCPECEAYYRLVQSAVPGGALVMAAVALAVLMPRDIGVRRKAHVVCDRLEFGRT